MTAPATLLKDLSVYAISKPRFENSWWCVDLSNGRCAGFETLDAAMKFYRENQKVQS